MKMVVFVHQYAPGNPLIDTREYLKFYGRFNPKSLCRYYAIKKGIQVWFDIFFFEG